jgi:HK97 family phage major capsid protein
MELTKEELTQITTEASTAAVKAALAEAYPGGKFTPGLGVGDEVDARIEMGASPEERLLADPKGGFRHFSHFAHSVYQVGRDGRGAPEQLQNWIGAIQKTAGHMEEENMAQGGYLVPIEFSNRLLMESLEASVVRPRATQIPMQSNVILIPTVVDATHASNTYFGGVAIYRPGEAAQKSATKPAFGQIKLELHELAGLCYVTNSLLEDSPISVGSLLNTQFGEAIGFVEDDDFLNGSGTNQALGAFNASNPAIVAVAKETGQAADTIVFENIIKMWARLYPRCHAKSVWVANIEAFPQLASMSMSVGTGGVPVWLPAGQLAGSPFGSLMGRPLFLSEKMQALGDQGDIGLADFSRYFIGEKSGGVQIATSIHIRFDYDETAFRFVLRYDGQPSWLVTLTPRRGAGTLSPFVVLAERA